MRRSSGVSSRISCRAAALGISSSSAVRSSGDISFRIETTCSCAIAAEQLLLRLDFEIFENVRRQRVRQDAENDDLFVLRQIENHLRPHRPAASREKSSRSAVKFRASIMLLDFG